MSGESSPSTQGGAPFMVLAHHRSGSNFLADVLQAHPHVECLSEPLSMHTSGYLPHDLLRWTQAEYRADVLHPELAAAPEAVRFTKDLAAFVGSAPSGTARGFKETLGFEKLSWMRQVFPGLRIVLLVRDPRAVVRAVLSRQMEGLWDYPGIIARYKQQYGSVAKFGSVREFPIHDATPLDRVITSWQIRFWEARRDLGTHLATRVRFEDILTQPQRRLEQIMRVVGAPLHPEQLAFIENSHSGPSRGGSYSTVRDPQKVMSAWKRELSPDTIHTITERLSLEMEILGYE
ncbi:sulfotransferase [Streptomyces scabiei]|uniref:sulfotransferase n=1 Tax=Streptomyces scabiei TaxID=1930 RepID=UPI00298FC282|nr:sulfotransferase [Streptomyces scabiei]MDW8804346.1 sulfotransferase [Streptomyces scabiei]